MIASVLLAKAAFLEGRDVQAFPFFGVERRGAPVVAYTRVSRGPLRLTTSVVSPDSLIVMDPSLLTGLKGSLLKGLRPGGHVLLNAAKFPKGLEGSVGGTKIAFFDSGAIALKHGLGSAANPLVNTVVLGAFAKFTGLVGLASLEKAIASKVPVQIEDNIAAAREAYVLMEGP